MIFFRRNNSLLFSPPLDLNYLATFLFTRRASACYGKSMKDSWRYINYGGLFLAFHLDHWALISVSLAPSLFLSLRFLAAIRLARSCTARGRGAFTAGLIKWKKHKQTDGMDAEQSVHLSTRSQLEAAKQKPALLFFSRGRLLISAVCTPAFELKPLPPPRGLMSLHFMGLQTQESLHPKLLAEPSQTPL